MLMGTPSRKLRVDIGHRWVHASRKLENGDLFFATVWGCQTGDNYKFVEIRVINPEIREISDYSYNDNEDNEEDGDGLEVRFNIDHKEVKEAVSRGQLIDDKALIQHGGLVVAKLVDLEIVKLVIDGNPGQVLDVKSFRMTESRGHIVVDDSRVLGRRVVKSNSAIYESTTEILGVHLPLVVK